MPKKKKMSNHEIGAAIRKKVEARKKQYSYKFKVGEFVREKYVTSSVGLILETVQAKKTYPRTPVSYFGGSIDYAADKYYIYTVKVLWLHHPDVVAGTSNQVGDFAIRWLIPHKEKKVLEKR